MGRHTLRIMVALGLVVTVMSGAGVFAVFTDTANSGQQSVTSGEVAPAADLKLAQGVIEGEGVSCIPEPGSADTFTDDLTVAASTTDVQPSADPVLETWLCLLNAGSSTVAVDLAAMDVLSTEVGCTGDEDVVDVTCGTGSGELINNLRWLVATVDCASRTTIDIFGLDATILPGVALSGAEGIAPGATLCLTINVLYPLATPLNDVLAAQSDTVSWIYQFSAATS